MKIGRGDYIRFGMRPDLYEVLGIRPDGFVACIRVDDPRLRMQYVSPAIINSIEPGGKNKTPEHLRNAKGAVCPEGIRAK